MLLQLILLLAINMIKMLSWIYLENTETISTSNEHLFHFFILTFFLYSKGDFDGAISQYIKTIGKLEPSYVIKKFLDSQRIHNLTLYLQKLHEAKLANANHTTLLLNCYTKLKDVSKLDEFIKVLSLPSSLYFLSFLTHIDTRAQFRCRNGN